jgi:signal transduction histidine kinase/CheY-like chemotaxis protein
LFIFTDTHINKSFYTQLIPLKNSEGRVHRIIVISRDITDIKILNTQLTNQNERLKLLNNDLTVSIEKAEESDRLKSAFLANMSHEIRTPMNGILGFAELLKEPGLTGDQQQEFIRIIEKSGARMLNIINDIVSISKIESGTLEVSNIESNINHQLEYIYDFFKPEAEAKGLQLSFLNSLAAKNAIIRTDREKVFAILTNLVKNAIKYTHEGTIEFGYLKKDDFLEFYVKDTGIGVPKHRQVAIFERFVQADIEDKMALQGAGLGLAITKSYVEMLGGKIWVESEEGLGSTFYFTLPYTTTLIENTENNIVAPADTAYSFANKLKILIVEDDETSEKLISINVTDFSNEVIKARNGIEGIEICRNIPDIDLILMDIQMPLMNGYEASRQIRHFNNDVIIIAQTAFGLSGDREKAIAAGCNDYITKPISKTALMSLIHKYFKK